MRSLARVLACTVLATVGLVVVAQVGVLQLGPLALIAILTPHLVLLAVGTATTGLLIARSASSWAAAALAVGLAVAVLGPEWVSAPVDADRARTLSVLSWNLEVGSRGVAVLPEVLRTIDADVVALQELTPEAAEAIEADPAIGERFPHRVLRPASDVTGLGLLSRHPVHDPSTAAGSAVLAGRVTVDGRTLHILNVHPLPGRIVAVTPLRLPIAFDGSTRDERLRGVRAVVDDAAADGSEVIVLGDLNVASTEPAYREFAQGLRDVHADVGVGPGWTWRPSRLEGLGVGLLRIDYVLVSGGIAPIAIETDCAGPGDHCIVRARVALENPPGSANAP